MATIKADPFPARPTRYKELGYRKDGPMLWRICDLTGERAQAVGAYYATKAELLADLDRYAAEYGCDGTTHAAPTSDAKSPLDVIAALLPYAESRAEDLSACAEVPEGECVQVPCKGHDGDAKALARKAWDAVEAGRVALKRAGRAA